MDSLTDFFARLDAFAADLDPTEQAMLRVLLDDPTEAEAAGFGIDPPWTPSRSVLSPVKIAALGDIVGGDISGTDLGSSRWDKS